MAVQDACGAREDEEIRSQIREFAGALGCRVRELPLSGERAPCCGYGGMVKYASPEMAERKAAFAAAQADCRILTYCMGCRDQLARAGADTVHILELVYGTGKAGVPGLSERRAIA